MPDTRLTWARLREHLRRYIAVYLAGIVVCMVLSNLLLTTTAPRVPGDQSILIYLADAYSNPSPLAGIEADTLKELQQTYPDIREVEFQSLSYAANEGDYASSMVLMTRLATQEGDAFLCNDTCMQALIASRAPLALDNLVAQGWLEAYGLTPYMATTVDEETGEETTWMAGLHIDNLKALSQLGVMNSDGACLALLSYSENPAETVKALDIAFAKMTEAADASTDPAE